MRSTTAPLYADRGYAHRHPAVPPQGCLAAALREPAAIARAACLCPSTAELFSPCGCRAQTCKTEVYDINHGHKMDLATGVEKSARILSNTRGTKDRFKVRNSCRMLATVCVSRRLTASAGSSACDSTRLRTPVRTSPSRTRRRRKIWLTLYPTHRLTILKCARMSSASSRWAASPECWTLSTTSTPRTNRV